MAVTALLVMPAGAKHRHGHHRPVAQPLSQRADQPLKPKGKHRLRSRAGQRHKPKPVQSKFQGPPAPSPAAVAPQVPATVPVPELRPTDAPEADAAATKKPTTVIPTPTVAPDRTEQEKPEPQKSEPQEQSQPAPSAPAPSADTQSEPEPAEIVPVPRPRPDIAERQGPETAAPENPGVPESGAQPPAVGPQPSPKPAADGDKKMLPDPRSADLPDDKMPAAEVACRARLTALGVQFEEHKAESDPAIGCSIPYPIMLKTLGKSIEIGSGTELNCQMAEAAARFAADVIQPAAKAEFGADLKSISQASAYVCRPRHGTRKLSEHAFGNALDIASFTLSDGKKIEVGPSPPEKDAKFLDAVRKAACGPFKTVLGPGADADHALHFHLDLEPRRNGGTFCQ